MSGECAPFVWHKLGVCMCVKCKHYILCMYKQNVCVRDILMVPLFKIYKTLYLWLYSYYFDKFQKEDYTTAIE